MHRRSVPAILRVTPSVSGRLSCPAKPITPPRTRPSDNHQRAQVLPNVRDLRTSAVLRAHQASAVAGPSSQTTYSGMSAMLGPVRTGLPEAKYGPEDLDGLLALLNKHGAESAEPEQQSAPIQKRPRRRGFPQFPTMLRRISQGQIIGPMSDFYAIAQPRLVGHQGPQHGVQIDPIMINALMQELSRAALVPPMLFKGVSQKVKSEHMWRPVHLSPDEDLQGLPVHSLCAYALASVYDIASAIGVEASPVSLAATIRALSHHLDLSTFAQCLTLVLLQMSRVPFHRAILLAQQRSMCFQEFDANRVSIDILTAVIDSFGLLDRPELGEKFLQWWSSNRSSGSGDQDQAFVRLPDEIGLPGALLQSQGWKDDKHVWCALVRSRAASGDLAGSKHWLQQYRRYDPVGTARDCAPYLAYLRGCSAIARVTPEAVDKATFDEKSSRKGLRYAYIREGMDWVIEDGVVIDARLFVLLLNLEVGYGNLVKAADIVDRSYRSNLVKGLTPHLTKTLLRLHRLYAIQNEGKLDLFNRSQANGIRIRPRVYDDIRTLFLRARSDLRGLEQPKSAQGRMSTSQMMKEAVRCAVTVGDLPLALTSLQTMDELGFALDGRTVSNLSYWLGLCQNGFGGAHKRPPKPHSNASHGDVTERRSALDTAYERLLALAPESERSRPVAHSDASVDLIASVTRRMAQTIRSSLLLDAQRRASISSKWVQDVCTKLHKDTAHPTLLRDEELIKAAMGSLDGVSIN